MRLPTILRGDGKAGRRFGAALRRWRRKRGWSGRELARRAEVSTTHYSYLELGRVNPPSEDCCLRFALALDLAPAEVLAAAGRVPAEVREAFRRHPCELLTCARALLGRLPEADAAGVEPDPDLGRDEK